MRAGEKARPFGFILKMAISNCDRSIASKIEMDTPELKFAVEINSLLEHIRELTAAAISLAELEKAVVESISSALPRYNWTGFYWLDPHDPQTLVLGAFVGEPTPHVRIPVTQGICGAAVASGETVIVDDVHADPRYLSCSIKTKSEIVVPIYAHGKVVGEIDIDSHIPAAFAVSDRAFLEEVARILGAFIEDHSAAA
jgi:GAF domain-containing protein